MPTMNQATSRVKLGKARKGEVFPVPAEARKALRQEIADARGAEVLSAATVQADGSWGELRVLARGNTEAAPAILRGLRPGDVLLHNHPGGDLHPSDADLAVAHSCGSAGIGFAIHDNECRRVYVVVEPFRSEEPVRLDAGALCAHLQAGGSFSRIFSAFEARTGQIKLLRKVVEAFNQPCSAILEGETGVGKSLAYLLPAVTFALENQCRVVISTNTINLQMQLVNKDLPMVKEGLQRDFTFILVKGRGNYLCRRRLAEMSGSGDGDFLLEAHELEDFNRLLAWAEQTSDGSLSDLSWIPTDELWEKVNADKDTCLGVKCQHFRECFFYRARRKTAEADILVVNHHLLFTDLALRAEVGDYDQTVILPGFKGVVLDEAHNIEDVATSHFGLRTSGFGFAKILGRLFRRRGRRELGILPLLTHRLLERGGHFPKEEVEDLARFIREEVIPLREEIGETSRMFFSELGDLALPTAGVSSAAIRDGEFKLRVDQRLTGTRDFKRVSEQALELAKRLQSCHRLLRRVVTRIEHLLEDEDDLGVTQPFDAPLHELKGVAGRTREVREALQLMFDPETENRETYVHFFSVLVRGKNRYSAFHSAPIEVGEAMREYCFKPISSVILVSGTLSTQNHFEFIKQRLGMDSAELDPAPIEGRFSSPFDYAHQARLFIPTDLPEPSDPSFSEATCDPVLNIAGSSRGGTLVLCTSYFHLRKLYDNLAQRLGEIGIEALRQGDMERSRLLEKFREDGNAVLFATESFWEGVDVPGNALRNLVITKLPFAVPDDPVLQARQERLEQEGRKPFTEYQVPRAIIKLKQGFGRLIRHKTDSGTIWILDRRIVTKFYGRFFLESLPPAPVVSGRFEDIIGRAYAFFNEQGSR
jgi:ATP-dependent DNA helicase DinG